MKQENYSKAYKIVISILCIALVGCIVGFVVDNNKLKKSLNDITSQSNTVQSNLLKQVDNLNAEIKDLKKDINSLENDNLDLSNRIEELEIYSLAANEDYQDTVNYINGIEAQLSRMTLEERIDNTFTMEKYQYKSDTAEFGYWLYLPNLPGDENEQLPLIVSLHSGNGTGRNLDQLIDYDNGMARFLHNGLLRPNAIILMPQSPTGWTRDYDDLMELIEYIANEYNVDKKKISLTGVSRGGVATFEMVIQYPNYFSAAVPIASAVDWGRCNVIKTPMRIYHGAGDTGMGFSVVEAEKVINNNGGQCELFLLKGVGHSGQFVYYENDYGVIEWMTSQVNERN